MYNNPYINNYTPNYNQQSLNDKIDNQIAQLQQMKEQMKNSNHQPAINQTFQLAPQNNGLKIVNDIEEVKKELTIVDTPFINNDYSKLWIKNAKGNIRIFNLEEIIPKDDKDILIENLQLEINRLKGKINNEQYYVKSNDEQYYEQQSEQFDESIKAKTTSNVPNIRTSKSKSK